MLLQVSQRIRTLPVTRSTGNIELTIAIHAPSRSPQLNRDDDEAYDPEDEEDERPHYNDPGEELSLGDQPEHHPQEEEC